MQFNTTKKIFRYKLIKIKQKKSYFLAVDPPLQHFLLVIHSNFNYKNSIQLVNVVMTPKYCYLLQHPLNLQWITIHPPYFFFITKCLKWLSVRQKIDLLQCLKQIASLSHHNFRLVSCGWLLYFSWSWQRILQCLLPWTDYTQCQR